MREALRVKTYLEVRPKWFANDRKMGEKEWSYQRLQGSLPSNEEICHFTELQPEAEQAAGTA